MTLQFTSKIAFIASLLIGFSAQAVVLPNGAFVPQQCGLQSIEPVQKDAPMMESACVGTISGTKQRAVRFTTSDKASYVYRVVSQANLMMALTSGATMSVFHLVGENGDQVTMKAIVNHDGSVQSISGEFQNNSFLVPSFQQMFTIQ